MSFTPEEITQIKGQWWIKCVKAGGHTLTNYGQKAFAEGEEIDLIDDATPDTLRAADFLTAKNMCTDPALELAQLVAAGDFEVSRKVQPDPTILMRRQS